MTNDELKEFGTRCTAAWNSQNAASVSAFFAEEGSLSVNGSPAVGREAITAVAQGFMTAFPDMELVMDDLKIQPDEVSYPKLGGYEFLLEYVVDSKRVP